MFRFAGLLSIRLFVDAAIWAALSGAFMLLFIGHFGAPLTAVAPHLMVVSYFALLAACFRYISFRLTSNSMACLIGAAISSGMLFLLAIYYASVLVGLDGWGRVISYPLILTYADQAGALLEVLAIPSIVACFVVLITYLAIFYLIRNIYSHWDWIPYIANQGSPRFSLISVLLSLVIFGIMAYQFVHSPPLEAGEPLSLTLNPNYGKSLLQNHRVSVSKRLESLEVEARASYAPNPVLDSANVIVIVVDALRADHLSLNGYHRTTTPHLDHLMREGKLDSIRNTYGSCAESTCGLMALASSRNLHALPSQPFTLQEVLKSHGFRLHMLLSGDHTNFYGLKSAYGPVDSYMDGSSQKKYYINDDRLVIEGVSNLPKFDGSPSFFQFHLMSTHGLSKRDPADSPFKPFNNYYADLVRNTVAVDDDRAKSYINYYDNGVLRTDQMIRGILEALDAKGYLKKALVVITADHGELLGEHGLFSHAKTVFRPILDIPLIFLRFGYQPRNEIPASVVASQIDIAPTILTELDMPIPSSWSGLPLQKMSSRPPKERYLFFQQGTEFGLVEVAGDDRRWKYWIDAQSDREYAFETLADPGEERNRIADVPAAVKDKWRIQLLKAEVQARELSGVKQLPE